MTLTTVITLENLKDLSNYVLGTKAKMAFVFYNNISMSHDASQFKKLIEGYPSSSPVVD